jgi:hypothetical protein
VIAPDPRELASLVDKHLISTLGLRPSWGAAATHRRIDAAAAAKPKRSTDAAPSVNKVCTRDDGLDLLRRLLARVDEREHPQFRPLRWRRRREAHRAYMRFASRSYPRCS